MPGYSLAASIKLVVGYVSRQAMSDDLSCPHGWWLFED
jgi:hypothetical protein